jgi:hypothetical protein
VTEVEGRRKKRPWRILSYRLPFRGEIEENRKFPHIQTLDLYPTVSIRTFTRDGDGTSILLSS